MTETLYAGTADYGVYSVDVISGDLTPVGSCENSIYSLVKIGETLYAGTIYGGVLAYGSEDSGDDGDHGGHGGGSTPNDTTEIKTTVSGNTATVNILKQLWNRPPTVRTR